MTSRTAKSKRTCDSPSPDQPAPAPKKSRPTARAKQGAAAVAESGIPAQAASRVTASRRKGRASRDGMNTIDPRAPSEAVYEAYVHPVAAAMLSNAPSEADYCVGLEYFWAQLFTASRDFNPDECAELFRRTLPRFAGDESSDIGCKLAERFEDVFNTYQGYFIERVNAYSRRWLETESGKDWFEARSLALRRKSKDIRMPPNPAKPDDLLAWNGKSGLDWGLTQCTDFWLICLRGLKTVPAIDGEVRWFAREDSGELWYKELTRIALELIRSDIVARHASGKKEIAREHQIFDLRRVMSEHAEDLKATPRISLTVGRSLPPLPALDSIRAARPPKFDSDAALKTKADFAGALPFPANAIAYAQEKAEATVAEQSEAFRAIYDSEISSGQAALPGGIDLPSEFFNPDDGVFTPKGDFVPTDSDQYVTDFAVAFAKAPVWEKAQLWDDYIGMEIARIDSQMILMLARRRELAAIREKAEKDYQQWLLQRQALEQAYRDFARTSQDIVDLRAKTGPDGRAPRGLSAQRAGNRFIPQNAPAGIHPLDAIPKSVRDAAAAVRFPGGLADRRGMAHNVPRGHRQGAMSIPPQQLHDKDTRMHVLVSKNARKGC